MRPLAILLLLPVVAVAQQPETKYWPRRDIGFPVPPIVLTESPKPVKLRLYAAPVGGRFKQVNERAANALEPIDRKPPGFNYIASGDGEEDFAVQLVYADGRVNKEVEDLPTQIRIVFDTRPPVIQIVPSGPYGVEWKVTDENLDEDSIRLEYRWVGESKYTVPTDRKFKPQDKVNFSQLRGQNRRVEIRVSAKDKAGHEMPSRPVTLPNDGSKDDRNFAEPTGDLRTPRAGDLAIGQPQIRYENTPDLTVKPKIVHVTRSGVQKLHLFVKNMDEGGDWKATEPQPVSIAYETADPPVEIKYKAPKEGRYGFIVVPESGAGLRDPDPTKSAPPQYLVDVDTTPPAVKIRGVLVNPGTVGPRVEIQWDAADRNLLPDPIVLEYQNPKTKEWKLITDGKLPNSRRYVWEVADKTLYEFYVRIRAVDQAGNTGEHVYEKKVNIDLEKPSATIDHVRGAGVVDANKRQ